jgi:hypothetical protein
MTKITEEIYYDNGSMCFHFHPAKKDGFVVETGRFYSFELFRKSAAFDGVEVDQFKMRVDSIYGRKGARPRNYEVLVEYYLAQCFGNLTIFDDEVLDSYILARLLPEVRRNGSRRIFDDAILTSPHLVGQRKQALVRQLDDLLAASRRDALDMAAFHATTNRMLGVENISEAAAAAYQELTAELLGEGRRAVQRWGVVDGLQVPVLKFRNWMKTFARRSGNEDRKLALDMLSYESRAAMHRCYSAVWFELLKHLEQKYELDEASLQFHRLMHFDVQLQSNLPESYFHLFHGHIFALHPGLNLFFETPTGGELIGDYLRGGTADEPFRRLLNGFCVALGDYYVRSEYCSDERKRSSRDEKCADIEAVAAAQSKGRGRRRLTGPKRDDREDRADGRRPRRRD